LFELLQGFVQAVDLANPPLRLLFVGRSAITEELEDALGAPPPMVEVSYDRNSDDIKRFIDVRVAKSPKLRRLPKRIQEEIINKLNANGFFLWVTLMLTEIELKSDRPDQIKKALENLPKSLEEALWRIVCRYQETLEDYQIEDLNVTALLSTESKHMLI
jgi:hypothetical protein